MKIFSRMYVLVERWTKHRHADYYLSAVSFTESSFFPIPPDIMLLPMSVTSPNRAWTLAFITTISSVLGAILGYFIGVWGFDWVGQSILDTLHLNDKFHIVVGLFEKYGTLFVLIAAFTPLPYKLFTIAAGVLGIAFIPFILASIVGRGARFFLVAGLAKWFGNKYGDRLLSVIDIIGWVSLIIIALGAALYFGLR